MSAFDKHIPSVFVVCSPFQALCAVTAIRQLEIQDYKFYALLPRGEVRNSQVECVLNHFDIKYTAISPTNRFEVFYYKYRPLIKRNNKYKRLFLGDFRTVFLYSVGCGVVSDNANVVYLDDGNISISLLRGRDTEPLSDNDVRLLECYKKHRGFVFFKNLLTIYSDIPNSNFNIEGLQLSVVGKEHSGESQAVSRVYIVGTNLERFCGPLGLSEDIFVSYLDTLMKKLKAEFPGNEIVYIPHGCETKVYAETLCEKYGIRYLKPQMMIELELLSIANPPKAIYGFTSTALYTLKKLFPDSKVVNIVFDSLEKDNPFVIDILDCSKYYAQNGIECVNV